MLRRTLLCAVLLASGARPDAQAAPVPPLAELCARDARLAFTAESARRARAVLEAAPQEGRAEVEERSIAMLAFASGGGDLARIEARLEGGVLVERQAALLALGELGSTGWPVLERTLALDAAGLEEALCVALVRAARAGTPGAEERLQSIAAGSDSLARRMSLALAWRAGEPADALGETLRFYYELRWRAARTYGLIDGRRGPEVRKAELFADAGFQDRVVLAAATELPAHALKPHLTEILLASESPGAVRAAALVMPEELERALQAGEWKPSPETWRALLSEIDARRAERRAKKLLGLAMRSASELEASAGRLLFRAGGDLPWSWVLDQLEHGDAALRAPLVEACGERGEKERILDLAELLVNRDDPDVRATARVALARLGHAPARKELEELVQGPAGAEREQVVHALARVLHDRSLWRFAELALKHEDLKKDLRAELESGLASSGAPIDRARLRAELPDTRRQARRLALVRALARAPEAADLEALAALFPVEDDLDVNVELALVLLAQRHPATGGLLSSALWGEDWNRSVIAGGLIMASAGTLGLLDELENPPRTAGECDLRRVGFALGEWGGLGAVETLARTRSEGDPALQGALLGALSIGVEGGIEPATPRPRVKLDFDSGGEGGNAGAKSGGAKKKRSLFGG